MRSPEGGNSAKYSSDSNQELEVMIMEVFAVIRGWLMKDQSKYNELCSIASGYQNWQTLVL